MALWIFYSVILAVILALYGLKAILLRQRFARSTALIIFILAMAAPLPLLYRIDPDWNNRHVTSRAIYIGTPLAVLTIPLLSFLYDLFTSHRASQKARRIRLVIEICVVTPAWFYFSAFLCFWLGWIWI